MEVFSMYFNAAAVVVFIGWAWKLSHSMATIETKMADKVDLARLEVHVETMRRDIHALWRVYRVPPSDEQRGQ